MSDAAPLSSWNPPPRHLRLRRNEVHVWRASLDLRPSQVETWKQILSADERARAERFHFQEDFGHFVVAHGLLRGILGRYLNKDPRQLRFCTNAHGKPALVGESASNGLRFNLSHSSSLALYAITQGREVGVDLERIREIAYEDLAEQLFPGPEVSMLRALPPASRLVAFYSCWTRKEAYVKARGHALTLDVDDDPDESSRWSRRDLDPGLGYVGALAVERGDWRLTGWNWTHTDGYTPRPF